MWEIDGVGHLRSRTEPKTVMRGMGPPSACGIHQCVNTTSKLGQDLATNGYLLITPAVYEQGVTWHELDDLVYEYRMLKRSGLDLPCYCASRGTNGGGGTQRLQKAF